MRRSAIAIVVAILVLTPTGALADSPVTVDCGDGSPLSTVASVDTLAGLQASIQGMIDNPAGMSCALGAATLSLGTTSSSGAFVVGGGRYDRGPGPGATQGCGENFSLNAHSDASGFHGEQTYTINNADGCGDLEFKGHIKANVTCLAVFVNRAADQRHRERSVRDVLHQHHRGRRRARERCRRQRSAIERSPGQDRTGQSAKRHRLRLRRGRITVLPSRERAHHDPPITQGAGAAEPPLERSGKLPLLRASGAFTKPSL